MNIIDCTIKMRKEAQANYANLSLAVTDKEFKRLFSMLALAEDEHIDKLLAIQAETTVSPKTQYRLDNSVCAYRSKLHPDNFSDELRNDPDGYLHVVKDEEKSIRFFERLADNAESETMRKVCLAVADKEREHLQVVKNIYAFIEEPGTYLEWGEFSNLKSL
ncbi:MAG: ferritin family protein [Geobacteraceae bacterium]|nr:ferritin family protein [Geobacteraceae bacterium]